MAQTNASSSSQTISTSAAADKAYRCLNDEIANRTTLTFEQAIFASLALGGKKEAIDVIKSQKSNEDCWPKQKCTLKETSQVLLAYRRSGESTNGIEKWILSKNATPTELTWYLEIDIRDRSASQCSIRYDTKEGKVDIKEDMTVTRNTLGECFSISGNNYWLKISPQCLTKEFEISCNKDFVTALIYEKKSGETIYVSSDSHLSAFNGSTREKVEAKCLKTENICDYEGTLWAAFALNKIGVDVSDYLPYLSALMEDNTKYFPSTFLFTLSANAESSDWYTDIIQKQKRNGLWEITGSKYKTYYDTSLALIALSSSSSKELERAKTALVPLQKPSGCWSERDAIVDTAFLLYSGWQRSGIGSSSGGGGKIAGRCDSISGQMCGKSEDCKANGGSALKDFDCTGGSICCSKPIVEKSCKELDGIVCSSDKICEGQSSPSSDGSCCLTTCVAKQEDNLCSGFGSCKTSCDSDESELREKSCGVENMVCCITGNPIKEESKTNWFLIIILILLIAAIILAIIYRNKLQLWWYKFKGRASVSPVVRPGVPPLGGEHAMPEFRPSPKFAPANTQRPIIRPQYTNAGRPRTASPKDKEMEETLQKLREMSK